MTRLPRERGDGPVWVGLLDVVGIVLFALVGASVHDSGMSLGSIVGIAWPFLLGATVGWVLVINRSGRFPFDLGAGITVWVLTVVLGLALRGLTGGGLAISFVLVTLAVTALLLLGWRVLYRAVAVGASR